MGALLDDLATPFLYVDLDRMNRNIEAMATAARELGVRLRPHAKTHKIPEIARRQMAAGATGVTLAKVSEAEGREAGGRAEGEARVSAAADVRAIGLPIGEVSAGSTPTALPAASVRGVTEIRPGQYLFGCANVVAQGAMRADDVALFARATVISRPAEDRAVVDAGSKTLSTDGSWEPGCGFGYLASDPSTRVASLWEEHGVLHLEETARGLRVGDRVSIVPNHVCTAVNLHDRIAVIRDDRIEATWMVAARGRVE